MPPDEAAAAAADSLCGHVRYTGREWAPVGIECLHEEFKRRIKTQTVLPSAETAAMLFGALLASGQITMREVDGWPSLSQKPSDQIIAAGLGLLAPLFSIRRWRFG